MWFIYLLSWLAFVVQVTFVTLSIAAGLYYLADLVEEYTVVAARVIKALTVFTSVVYIGLFVFEELTTTMIVLGVVSCATYYLQMNTFPEVVITSPIFILSMILIIANHYLAFSYFTTTWYPFSEVLAYFTICLWLVPFAFFVSVSANENVLPVVSNVQPIKTDENDLVSNYFRKKGRKYGLLSLLKLAQQSVLPERVKKHF